LANNIPNNMRTYKYTIESMDILFPEEIEPTKINPNFIKGILLEHDFDNDYFPVFKLSVSIEPKVYFKILSNKLKVRFRIRMQKYSYDVNKDFQFKKDVFNTVFCVFMDEDTPYFDEKSYNESKKVERSEITPRDLSNIYSFYLFKESDLDNSKKIVNNVITSSTLIDTVVYLLSTCGMRNVLMTPLENKKVFKEILLPPLTLLNNLLYLNQQYGFYTKGALIFFDLMAMYIIDCNSKCTAFQKEEYKRTIFTIKELTDPNIFTPGSFVSDIEKENYINITPDNINIYSNSVVADQIIGNNFIIIDPKQGSVQNIKPETVQRGVGTYQVLVNNYGNEYSNNDVKNRKIENNTVININISDFDMEAVTPNKEFVFIFDNSKINSTYSGSYRLTKRVIQFKLEGTEFIMSGVCEFKKI